MRINVLILTIAHIHYEMKIYNFKALDGFQSNFKHWRCSTIFSIYFLFFLSLFPSVPIV